MKRGPMIITVAAFLFSTGGCDSHDSNTSPRAIDVEGATVVENVAGAWTDTEAWRVADDPAVVIGVHSGDARYEFGRIAGVAWLRDGRIVVADATANEVRYFDASGTHLLTVGREGQGPGEFVNISLIGTIGDTILLWDSRQSRLTLIGPRGEIERVVPLSRSDGSIAPRVLGVFSDGTLAAAFPTELRQLPADGEVLRDRLRLWNLDYRSGQRRQILNMPSHERLFWRGQFYEAPLITLAPVWTIHDDQLYVTLATTPVEVDVFGLDGALVLRALYAVSPEPTSPEDKELVRRIATQQARPGAMDVADAMTRLPIPEQLPYYDKLIVDEEGNIWARRFRAPSDPDWERPDQWNIFRADGVLLGEIAIPSRLTVHRVSSDAILGVWRDETRVEYIRIYPLLKPFNQMIEDRESKRHSRVERARLSSSEREPVGRELAAGIAREGRAMAGTRRGTMRVVMGG